MAATAYNIGALIATMGLDTTQFQAGMASVNASTAAADATTKKAAASMRASMNAVGVKMQAVGKKMTRVMTLPILANGVASTKVFSDFEASMAKITGLVGVAKSQVEAWKTEVLALGPATGQGPEKLADALFFITSAGIRGAEAMEVLEMAAKAASGGMGEAKVVADLVTSAMNAYGKENLSAAQATDILVATVREGKAEAADLAAAMGVVIPISSAFNVSFNEVGAAFAAMTRTGTNARVAATQLKAVLSSMASPSTKAEKAMAKFGTSSQQFRDNITQNGLISALLDLREATNGSKVAMAEIFPNIRGLMATLDLLGSNMEDNVAIFKALEDPVGALDVAFESASETIKFKFNKGVATLKTNMITLGTALSGSLIPIMEKVTAFIAKSTKKWNAMSDGQKQNRIRVLALTAAMGPLLVVTGRLIKMLATPMGPYAMAIAGAVALTLAIRKLVMKHREEQAVIDAVGTANEKVQTQYETQAAKIAYLVAIIEDENISQKGRIGAINELKTIMPGYNGMLTEEGRLVDHNTTAIEDYLVVLKEKIRLQIYEGEYVDLVRKQEQAQRDLNKATTEARIAQEKFNEAGGKKEMYIASPGQAKLQKQLTGEYSALLDANIAMAERKEALEKVTIAQAALTEEMKQTGLVIPGAGGGGAGGDGGGAGSGAGGDGGDADLELAEKRAQAKLDLARLIADEELELITNAHQKKAAAEQLSFERSKAVWEKKGADGLLTEEEVNLAIEALEAAHQVRMVQIAKDGADAAAKVVAAAEKKKADAKKEADGEAERLAKEEARRVEDLTNYKIGQAMAYMDAASRAVGALSAMTDRAMNKELAAAGKNKKERERIEKDYFQKKKKWSISQAIINGAMAVTQALASVPPPASYVLAAISGIAAAAEVAVIAAQNFALGAVVYGPTVANIGEYPGARSDPEVVSPLSKLKTIIGDVGGGGGKVIFEIEGRTLVGILQKENTLMNSY